MATAWEPQTIAWKCYEIMALGPNPGKSLVVLDPLVAYNLFSALKSILGSVHGTDVAGKLSYYYLADELEGTYRGLRSN